MAGYNHIGVHKCPQNLDRFVLRALKAEHYGRILARDSKLFRTQVRPEVFAAMQYFLGGKYVGPPIVDNL